MNDNPMRTQPILKLLIKMSVPSIFSMLILSLYNIVDSIFVARISVNALAAVSLAFPLQNLVTAVSVGFGVGVNACIATSMGAGRKHEVDNTAIHGMILTVLHGAMFFILGLLLISPFIGAFTKDPEVLRMGKEYSYIVILCCLPNLLQVNMEKMFQSVGNMIAPMLTLILGCVVNVILDPIMIFGYFGFPAMGVVGAAIATIIGQISSFLLSVVLFWRNSGGISLRLKGFRFHWQTVKRIYSIGVPSMLMMSLASVLVSLLNGILAGISQTAVAVLGIYFKLQTFIYMPANGVVQGMRPIVSFNYGAGEYQRLKSVIKNSMFLVLMIMIVGTFVMVVLPKQILQIFDGGEDINMITTGVTAFRIIGIGFIFSTVSVVFSGTFEALGMGVGSLIISLLRQMVVTAPLAFLLSRYFGAVGVWAAFPISEVAASLTAALIYRRKRKQIFGAEVPMTEQSA